MLEMDAAGEIRWDDAFAGAVAAHYVRSRKGRRRDALGHKGQGSRVEGCLLAVDLYELRHQLPVDRPAVAGALREFLKALGDALPVEGFLQLCLEELLILAALAATGGARYGSGGGPRVGCDRGRASGPRNVPSAS